MKSTKTSSKPPMCRVTVSGEIKISVEGTYSSATAGGSVEVSCEASDAGIDKAIELASRKLGATLRSTAPKRVREMVKIWSKAQQL